MVTFQEPPVDQNYYAQGSNELATETALTLDRLEARCHLTKNCERLVLVLVGLPARGKSFLARKLHGFLKWHGTDCQVFNVGKYRRMVEQEFSSADFFDAKNKQAAALREKAAEMALTDMLAWLDKEEDNEGDDNCGHFAPMNPEAFKSERCTRHADIFSLNLEDIIRQEETAAATPEQTKPPKRERIAIFDATNSTNARRQWVLEMCTSPERRVDKPTGCVFIESICDDNELLLENFKDKIANSPDYSSMPQEDAIADLQKRVQKYEEQYETIDNDAFSYIKIFNLSTKMLVNHIYGRMSKIIMPAMMAWNIGTRPIFLCRPGQTLGNITTDGEDYVRQVDTGQVDILEMSRNSQRKFFRGDHLGPEGKAFSQALYEFCRDEGIAFRKKRTSIIDMKSTGTSKTGLSTADYAKNPNNFPLQVYTSTMPRAIETVRWENGPRDIEESSSLNPLDKGDLAGQELNEIRNMNPAFYRQLEIDAFHIRFPGGESYFDLIKRLNSIVVDMEQQVTPTLVVSHVSVLQMLIAYFRNSPVEKCMDIAIPLHTVIKFTPARGGGWSESIHPLVVTPTESQERKTSSNPTNIPVVAEQQGFLSLFHNWPFHKSDIPSNGEKDNSLKTVLDDRIHRGTLVAGAASAAPVLGARK